eukprot:m.217412 g.217412  ORF g.217412 m.217412 type:complete len:83 (+) comp15559_c0_seq2:1429-1677(+)
MDHPRSRKGSRDVARGHLSSSEGDMVCKTSGLAKADVPSELLNHKFGGEHDFTDGSARLLLKPRSQQINESVLQFLQTPMLH